MKTKNKIKLDNAISVLNQMGIENNDIMVLGSITLDIVGLFPQTRESAHDVDVMIRCTKEKEKEILNIIKVWNSTLTDKEKEEQGSQSSTIVMNIPNKDLILNFWFVCPEYPFNTLIKLENGVWVEKPTDCIQKKKQYNRVKDLRDVRDIVLQIL